MYTDASESSPANDRQSLDKEQGNINFALSSFKVKELLVEFFEKILDFDFLKEAYQHTQSKEAEFAKGFGKFEFYDLGAIEKELVAHKNFLDTTSQTVEVPLLLWLDHSVTYKVGIYLNLDKATKQFKMKITYKKARSFSTKEYTFQAQTLSLLTEGSKIFNRFSLYSNQAISALELDAQP